MLIANPHPGRLDKALVQLLPDFSRARLQGLIADGAITVNGITITSAAHKLKGGENIKVIIPEAQPAQPQPQAIPLNIVYEDGHIIVIDKQVGLVVHPAAGHYEGTLVNALLAHCGDALSGIGGVKRPGLVHRLDKDTSGLMVVAKNDKAHQGLAKQFHDSGKTLQRIYQAFCWGSMKTKSGTVNAALARSPINRKKMAVVKPPRAARRTQVAEHRVAVEYEYEEEEQRGKHAITHYEMLESYGLAACRVSCQLETGRTHQIRVHLAHIGHSLIGDPLYGRATGHKNSDAILKLPEAQRCIITDFPRQALHAGELSFTHPVTRKKMRFTAPLPGDLESLQKTLSKLRS